MIVTTQSAKAVIALRVPSGTRVTPPSYDPNTYDPRVFIEVTAESAEAAERALLAFVNDLHKQTEEPR